VGVLYLKESSTEENGDNFLKKLLKEKEHKTSEFVGAIIANIILLYNVNNLLSWNLTFIAPSFQEVLWIFNISIVATIIANTLFLIYHPGWFRSVIQIILNILGFIVVYYLYTVFPFILNNGWVIFAVKFVLIVAMVVLVIVSIFEVVRLILRTLNSYN
jgi:hypothetical protein